MVHAIHLKCDIYWNTISPTPILLCFAGIDPAKKRVFIYFVAKLYLQPAIITENDKIDQKYESFNCYVTLNR